VAQNSNGPETATAVITQTTSRFNALVSLDDLTPQYLKDNYLTGLVFTGADNQEVPPSFFDEKLADAIARLETLTGIDVLERTVTGEVHDYHSTDYQMFAFMQLFRIPAQRVTAVRATYPTGQTVQVYPTEWVQLTVEHGQLHLVPTAGSLAQVMLGQGGGGADYLPFVFNGLSFLPGLWQVDYVSGFAPNAIPREVAAVICKLAAVEVLTVMSDLVGPLGVASSSLGVDGLSQSISRQLPAFKARLDALRVDLGLPGPGLGVDPKYGSGAIGQLRRTYIGMVLASM
jgi:hypothetical protein